MPHPTCRTHDYPADHGPIATRHHPPTSLISSGTSLGAHLTSDRCPGFQPGVEQSVPKTHGGKRPGAGAKPRNINALKGGAYTDRFYALTAARAVYPDLDRILRRLVTAERRKNGASSPYHIARKRVLDLMADAVRLTMLDPRYGRTLAALFLRAAEDRYNRLDAARTPEIAKKRSNHQDRPNPSTHAPPPSFLW